MSESGFAPMHKDDAVKWFGACHERFGELAALLEVIARRCDKHSDLLKLARLGKEIASEYENMADAWREELQKGGFRQ